MANSGVENPVHRLLAVGLQAHGSQKRFWRKKQVYLKFVALEGKFSW